ncbi:DeoR family transcriptional regulator [Serratia sp. DD3]|uniref:DeoR family transcriptional regulator n=1 Tax=Serratia sp. DD3 TaxID=1410619 RepID=UPI0004D81F0F|nr:DeoR family transcriptional regulator [Serratia sp. DD3]KEY59612.1 glycerol-3-phosphate regulon repressor [Serratia sp. DD3]
MMFREKRQEVILGLLDKNESLSVNYLARFFFISKETIRKDLSELAEKGVIQRYHGGASIMATSNTLCPGGKGANQALAASFADANKKRNIFNRIDF